METNPVVKAEQEKGLREIPKPFLAYQLTAPWISTTDADALSAALFSFGSPKLGP
jgi:hypothetical protein